MFDDLLDLILLLVLVLRLVLLLGVLLMILMLSLLLLIMMVPSTPGWRHFCRSTSEVHVDSTLVRFSGILKTELLTDLFDSRLDFLDVVCRMVALSDDSGIHEIHRFSSILPQEGEKRGKTRKPTRADASVHAPWRI